MQNPFSETEVKRLGRKGYTRAIHNLTKDLKIGECAPIDIEGLSYESAKAILSKSDFKGQFTTKRTGSHGDDNRTLWVMRKEVKK